MLVFYERFIEIAPIEEEIEATQMSAEEKEQLRFLVAEILHQHTLETILDQLEEEDRRHFLKSLSENTQVNLADILKDKMSDYEQILKARLETVREDIVQEIRKVKGK